MFLHLLAGALLLALVMLAFVPDLIPAWFRAFLCAPGKAVWVAVALVAGFVLLPAAVLAQTVAATPDDTVHFAPWVAFLKPYVDSLVMGLISVFVAFTMAQITKYTGVKVQAANVERLKASIATDVAGVVAAGADKLASQSFHIGSPLVATLADRVATRLPDVVKATGVTPDRLKEFALGEIGRAVAVTAAPATKS